MLLILSIWIFPIGTFLGYLIFSESRKYPFQEDFIFKMHSTGNPDNKYKSNQR